MASESGFSNQLKKGTSQFKTIHSVGSNKFGQSVASKALFEKMPSASIVTVTDVDGINGQVEFQIVELASHGALAGDILRIDAGDAINYEFDILEIIDLDTFKILALVDSGMISGVAASIMGWVTNKANSDGSQIVTVTIPGVATEAKQDAQIVEESAINVSTAAMNGKLQSKAMNVQVVASDIGLITNSVIHGLTTAGGGSYVDVKVTPSGALSVEVGVSALPTGAATEAKQDTGNTSLGSIDTKLTSQATAAKQDAEAILIGAVTETAPASDTASSGLNGRLQRVAQRITSLIALVPASLGQKASASGFAVTLSTEQEAEIGIVTETAPASDTASSGLNGRLQRIAQRITSLIALLPASLGQKAMSASLAVTIASDQSTLTTQSGYVAGTVSTAQITVGTSAVRATVAGTAPNAARKKLYIKPNSANLGSIYIGGSGVTTANGLQFIGPDRMEFEFDTGDYYLISDTAAQVVEILEKV